MCFHGKKRYELSCKKREIASVIMKKTVKICYHGNNRDTMCYHEKKTNSMCYHEKKER